MVKYDCIQSIATIILMYLYVHSHLPSTNELISSCRVEDTWPGCLYVDEWWHRRGVCRYENCREPCGWALTCRVWRQHAAKDCTLSYAIIIAAMRYNDDFSQNGHTSEGCYPSHGPIQISAGLLVLKGCNRPCLSTVCCEYLCKSQVYIN